MNLYIIVEGASGEKKVYPAWISCINKDLIEVHDLGDIVENNYIIFSGNGYPHYYQMIDAGIEDINNYNIIDYLIIAVDAEEASVDDVIKEIVEYVGNRLPPNKLKIIVQNPCLETWALGNRVVYRRHPEDSTLRKYLAAYDVRVNDPEKIPHYPEEGLNRAQFSFKYLKKILNDRYRNLTYTKGNPEVIMHPTYFRQIVLRYEEYDHIGSFASFINTFK